MTPRDPGRVAGDPAVFTTPRCVVRPWRPEEAARLLDIRRDPEVARWLSDPEPWSHIEQARTAIEEWSSPDPAEPHLGIWAIVPRATGMPVGTVSLKHLPDSDETEIGWYLHPDEVGRGYAREAARGALDHAIRAGVTRIWAVMWPENGPSARVAASLGMTDLGVRQDPWYGTDEYPDSRMFRYEATTGQPAP